ncbi:Spc98 family-domain-containing protein [Amylocarpus encephaloides]|uniref:Spindle pole body component n=1 Tax=Amylocarpus encephaloides TaxID=45428 RepID=A0A9P7YSF6_9HELO|nr:Spc98 family-domain-containing protein [Amylocarpus encephaloides]
MDHTNDDDGRPFAIPDLWGPSHIYLGGIENNGLLFSQLRLDDIDVKLPAPLEPSQDANGFFAAPDFTLGESHKQPVPNQSPSVQGGARIEVDAESISYDAFWLLPDSIPLKEPEFLSWEAFDNAQPKDLQSSYITENGPVAFDAAISAHDDPLHIKNTGHVVVRAKTYVSSLLALGLGRTSILYSWDEGKKTFIPYFPKMRISGYTGDCLDDLTTIFMGCGNVTRSLQNFIHTTYIKNTSPGRIALADVASTLLVAIQARLSSNTSKHNSLLQLQDLFRPAHSILRCFQQIVSNVSITRNDESMLSTIYQEIQLLEHRTDSLQDILLEVLSRVSQPWRKFSSEWLGTLREADHAITKQGHGKSFVKVENTQWIDGQGLQVQEPDFVLDFDKIPSFIAPEDARTMFEVGKSLRSLREHHPNHPLSKTNVIESACPPLLEWGFSWDDIMEIQSKARQYEEGLVAAIQKFSDIGQESNQPNHVRQQSTREAPILDFFGRPESDMKAHILASIGAFDRPLRANNPNDRLSRKLDDCLLNTNKPYQDENSSISPPLSLIPTLCFGPIISAQARIVHGTCMRMLFRSHHLREHLDVQRSFHLLGNGVFSSRLSQALFDPDLETAERQRGVARSGGPVGLRLGGRDSWPPASSELRLALMGVLTESHATTDNRGVAHANTFLEQGSLPGDLSFAVRDMSDEEIERCMDPDSIEALDFLRLSYKPPAPLDTVITALILYKYDQIFKLLLRMIRMLYITSALFRGAMDRGSSHENDGYTSKKFRIEAHHFISSVCGYFFDTGIESTWRIFQRKLDSIERRIATDDDNGKLGMDEGVDRLRDYHERVLDRIMFALFLRKRQQPVLKLLEEILGLTLQFSKHSLSRPQGSNLNDGTDQKIGDLHARFRKKVSVFITVCRSLSEKKGYGERKHVDGQNTAERGLFAHDDLAEGSMISHLLSRLEISNYYSRATGSGM